MVRQHEEISYGLDYIQHCLRLGLSLSVAQWHNASWLGRKYTYGRKHCLVHWSRSLRNRRAQDIWLRVNLLTNSQF
jgi:hypothetical protein